MKLKQLCQVLAMVPRYFKVLAMNPTDQAAGFCIVPSSLLELQSSALGQLELMQRF